MHIEACLLTFEPMELRRRDVAWQKPRRGRKAYGILHCRGSLKRLTAGKGGPENGPNRRFATYNPKFAVICPALLREMDQDSHGRRRDGFSELEIQDQGAVMVVFLQLLRQLFVTCPLKSP